MSELVLTPSRERVQSCTVSEGRVDLHLADGRVVIETDPDQRMAQRVCGLATRVLNVEFLTVDHARPVAEVTAVWHRVPHTRVVPLSAALALTMSGVPTYVVEEGTP